jgi:hypothetical protein
MLGRRKHHHTHELITKQHIKNKTHIPKMDHILNIQHFREREKKKECFNKTLIKETKSDRKMSREIHLKRVDKSTYLKGVSR